MASLDLKGTRKRLSEEKETLGYSFFFFFTLLLFYFIWRIITLQYCNGFCHTSTLISHEYTAVSPTWIPLPTPSHPNPLGCPSALILGALLHASNLHWSPSLHMVTFMSQCSCVWAGKFGSEWQAEVVCAPLKFCCHFFLSRISVTFSPNPNLRI